jgi:hypothetical protein
MVLNLDRKIDQPYQYFCPISISLLDRPLMKNVLLLASEVQLNESLFNTSNHHEILFARHLGQDHEVLNWLPISYFDAP